MSTPVQTHTHMSNKKIVALSTIGTVTKSHSALEPLFRSDAHCWFANSAENKRLAFQLVNDLTYP